MHTDVEEEIGYQELSDSEFVKQMVVAELAAHEAGHAIIALATGRIVSRVELLPHRGCVYSQSLEALPYEMAGYQNHLTLAVSGHVAETMWEEWTNTDFLPEEGLLWDNEAFPDANLVSHQFADSKPAISGETDLDVAVRNAVVICGYKSLSGDGASRKTYKKRILDEIRCAEEYAESILRKHWEIYVRVVEFLAEQREVTGDELKLSWTK